MVSKSEAHFVNVPGNFIPHSKFDLSFKNITSFDTGQLVPLCEPIEVVPSDTFSLGVSSKITLNTLIFPIMDDLFLDVFEFFVPFRITWEHYVNFEGENDVAPWVSQTTYSMPQVTAPSGGWSCGSLADYMGLPINVENISVNALAFRGYAKIVKDWFYDENIQNPPDFVVDDATIEGSNGDDYVTDLIKGGKPFIVGKTHDKFTSCLPAPQKGPSVKIPLGQDAMVYQDTVSPIDDFGYTGSKAFIHRTGRTDNNLANPVWNEGTANRAFSISAGGYGKNGTSVTEDNTSTIGFPNVYADLSNATAASINDLRLAFQTQRLFELMARGGTRYYEILASQWGISAPAGLIQRSEYLGGSRFNLKISTSIQNSATDDVTPQGNLAGYSITTNYKHHFKKAFSERGLIFILGCVRYHHSYSQGIPKFFKRKDRFDFYHNAFAHIGEQPVYNDEIYAQGNNTDKEVFGYNEYGVDYRFRQNQVTGQMRPTYSNSLSFMHLGDKFTELPTLTSDFIKEDKNNVDRVIAVSTETGANQIRADFYFDVKAIRPMPNYATPGLIDHL